MGGWAFCESFGGGTRGNEDEDTVRGERHRVSPEKRGRNVQKQERPCVGSIGGGEKGLRLTSKRRGSTVSAVSTAAIATRGRLTFIVGTMT